ncbi:hypothetical protein BOTBODRAFT_27609 [Botryobasidium botryosum FD-172 SS1]|uniref:Homeobox domain-containing protein n=1 Tax=Botryobasidium botryosum (strain FD-172 SS1) TaxID=930990 RepID=A0A067N7T9_BOTB1|nr:hypothetical protein BOTBODRAFT_27609 [Botryobasidium botryosum FD-172 SS1]
MPDHALVTGGPNFAGAPRNVKKRRSQISASTRAYLEEVWKRTAYPTGNQYKAIAAHVGDRSVGQVKTWFKQQRLGMRNSSLHSEPGAGSDIEDDEEELLFPELVASSEFARLQQLIRKCPNPSERRVSIWLRVLKVENLAEVVALWIRWKQDQDHIGEAEEGDISMSA